MTRKDYQTIAECLGAAMAAGDGAYYGAAVADVGARLAVVFAAENPRFDVMRFRAAVVRARLKAEGAE